MGELRKAAEYLGCCGARLLYPPSHSLGLKPMDQAFAKLKGPLRQAGEVEGLWAALERPRMGRPCAATPAVTRVFPRPSAYFLGRKSGDTVR